MKKPTREEALTWAQNKSNPPSVLAWSPTPKWKRVHREKVSMYVISDGEWFFNHTNYSGVVQATDSIHCAKFYFGLHVDQAKEYLKDMKRNKMKVCNYIGEVVSNIKSFKIFEVEKAESYKIRVKND